MLDREMIERVAKAIFEELGKGTTNREEWAIAAIEAMREPTEKMINRVEVGEHFTKEEIWQNYIDSILND